MSQYVLFLADDTNISKLIYCQCIMKYSFSKKTLQYHRLVQIEQYKNMQLHEDTNMSLEKCTGLMTEGLVHEPSIGT